MAFSERHLRSQNLGVRSKCVHPPYGGSRRGSFDDTAPRDDTGRRTRAAAEDKVLKDTRMFGGDRRKAANGPRTRPFPNHLSGCHVERPRFRRSIGIDFLVPAIRS